MKYKLADDAQPQVKLLLIATALTVAVWFIPYAEYVVYPIRLLVTFIHESGHALVATLTGGSVQSLTISADGSGLVYSASSNMIGALFTSSAGYLGTMVFGVLMLYLIRRNFSSQKILFILGGFVGVMTIVFGVISPIFHFFTLQVPFSSVAFTVVSGSVIAVGLMAIAMYASPRITNFAVSFLAVQCILNALSDLKTVLLVNSPLVGSDMQTDAGNMANATGIPAFLWVAGWIGISAVLLVIGFRMYAAVKSAKPDDSLFED